MTCLLLTGFLKILKDAESVCTCAHQREPCHTIRPLMWDAGPPAYHRMGPMGGMNASIRGALNLSGY